ncbi:unnamed protein product [Eretmochelys imbricata]
MLQSPHGIDHVLSNCPLTPLSYTAGNLTTAQVSLAQAPPWDRELELLVYYTEPPKPSAVLEAGLPGAEPGSLMGDPAVMMTLLPRVPEVVPAQSQPGSSSSCWAAPAARPAPWTQRPETLVLLLKSLPLGCYFNIYGFGSEFESFYPQSVENTRQTKAGSLQRLQLLQANLGGTEILEPLRAVYRSPCRDGHPRQLFVFTDGEVENTQDIIAEDPQVLLLRHRGWGFHGSDQRHCSGSRGQRQVHHRTGPHAAQGASVSEVGPAAVGDRDLTELGSAPWDPGGAAALGPRGDLCWAAVPCLRPAPRAAPAPRHSHGGHHPAVSHPGPDLPGDTAVLPAATGWRQVTAMLPWLPSPTPGCWVLPRHVLTPAEQREDGTSPPSVTTRPHSLPGARIEPRSPAPPHPTRPCSPPCSGWNPGVQADPVNLSPWHRLPVHRLAAKSLLLELEGAVGAGSEGDGHRALEASLSSRVVCSLTAYVGVDVERGQLVRWDVPLAGNPQRAGAPGARGGLSMWGGLGWEGEPGTGGGTGRWGEPGAREGSQHRGIPV